MAESLPPTAVKTAHDLAQHARMRAVEHRRTDRAAVAPAASKRGRFDPSMPPGERVQRPAGMFEAMVRELAGARREAAALRRQNDMLRTDLSILRAGRPSQAPSAGVRCGRCGLTVSAPAVHHDRTLLLASCCPHCDGPLVTSDAASKPASEPSLYLG